MAASCMDPDFYGSETTEQTAIATQRTIEIAQSGTYRVIFPLQMGTAFDGLPEFSSVAIVRCGDCDEQFLELYTGADVDLHIPAGRYTLVFEPIKESVVTFDLKLIEADP
jgi:hypothetical protein